MPDREREGAPGAGELAALRHALAQATGRRRLDLLLEAPDPASAVRALPGDELYHAIQDVGLADAADVVQLASPEQFRTFVDLDAWRGGELDTLRLLPWLRAARGASSGADRDEDLAGWREKLGALDSEVVSLLLATALRIHDLEEDPDPEIEGERFVRTPEGRYIVEFEPDGADYVSIRRLVDDLYERDPFLAGRTLSAVRWEIRSDLEEGARRWRDGRLADLGFPDLQEALSWFARPAARPATAAPGLADRPPGFWLATFRRDSLLDRAAARLGPEEAERFESQLLSAANAAIVADRIDPADPDAVRGAVESARTLIEMGLEALSGDDPEAGGRVLATTPLKTVFQQGFGRLLALRWTAERILREAAAEGPVPALDSPLGEALAAATLRRPRFYPGIDLPRDEWGQPAAGALEERAFRSSAEVERTARALEDAASLLALGRSIGLVPPAGPNPPTLATLYLTALANERLGRAFAPMPVAAAELPAVAHALATVDDPRLDAAGAAGALLRDLARGRASELAPIRAGESPPAGAILAVLVSP